MHRTSALASAASMVIGLPNSQTARPAQATPKMTTADRTW